MDRRAKRVQADIAGGRKPARDYTEAMRLYHAFLTQGSGKDTSGVELASAIHDDTTQREILEALLLSECPADEIETVFQVPQAVTALYADLFFDVTALRTGLQKLSYIENYPGEFGRALKARAVKLGYAYVLYTYGNIVPERKEQKDLVLRLFMTTAYKAMNANFCGMTTATATQAIEQGKLMLKAYEALARLNAEDIDENYDLSRILTAPAAQDQERNIPREDIV